VSTGPSSAHKKAAKLALLVALALLPLVASAEDGSLVPGRTKVRVTTGPEVRIDGFSITKSGTRGFAVSEDGRSVTLRLEGRMLRLPRPEAEIVGTLESIDDAKLTLALENGALSIVIPRDAITKLETPAGRRGAAGAGAAVGGLLGGLLVLLACQPDEWGSCSWPEDAWPAAKAVGLFGGVGALVGAAIRSEKWAVVPVPNVPAGPRGQRTGAPGLAIAFRF
jgi:hypothetical protein